MAKSFILKYNGDGATPDAILTDSPANGFQAPASNPNWEPDESDGQLNDAVEAWVRAQAHATSGLANVHITVTVENSGPNVGDVGEAEE